MHATKLRVAAALTAVTATSGLAIAQADPPTEDEFVRWSELLDTGIRFELYGFIRTDAQWSDSRFNDIQIPGYVQSEDPAAPASVGAEADDGDFALHGRLSRLGLNLRGPDVAGLGDASLDGRVEVDFYNIGLGDSDSRSALRMRHAYVKLGWENFSLLAGQTSDLISPLYPSVNNDLVMWGAGNTGDRRPQVRGEYTVPVGIGDLSIAAGIGLSGAIAGATAEGGIRSGENSGEPMVNARIGLSGKNDAGGGWQVGVWGHSSSEDYDAIGAGSDQSYDSSSVGLDARIPIVGNDVWLQGEYWEGENVDDIRGGIFQGVNSTTGELIDSEGGFVELGFRAGPHTTLHAGFSFDDPDDDDLNVNQRAKNEVTYMAARWRFDAVQFGAEYLNWETDYVGLGPGDADRVQFFIAFHF